MDGKAAANLSFRLGAWLHLWKGFAKEEPWWFSAEAPVATPPPVTIATNRTTQ